MVAAKPIRPGVIARIPDLFDISSDVLGVLLMALENFQAGLQQVF
jgi:hypothetical protein